MSIIYVMQRNYENDFKLQSFARETCCHQTLDRNILKPARF